MMPQAFLCLSGAQPGRHASHFSNTVKKICIFSKAKYNVDKMPHRETVISQGEDGLDEYVVRWKTDTQAAVE